MAIFPAATGAGGVNDVATTGAQQKVNLGAMAQALRDIYGTADTTTAIMTVIDQGSDRPATVAAAATTSLTTGNVVTISNASGATTITSLGTAASGARRNVVFSIAAGSVLLTHNATSLQLPGSANIAVASGDRARFESLGGGNWRCVDYIPANYRPDGSAGAIVTIATTATLTTAAHCNATILLTGAAAYAVTLPSAATMPAGSKIKFQGFVSGGVGVAITRAGTDTISGGPGTTSTVANVYGGDTLELTCNGATSWYVTGGKMRFETAWTATLPAQTTTTNITHGLGATPRHLEMVVECTTAENGFVVGERIHPWTMNSTYGSPPVIIANATTLTLIGQASNPTGAWWGLSRTGAVFVALTAANWKYKVSAEL